MPAEAPPAPSVRAPSPGEGAGPARPSRLLPAWLAAAVSLSTATQLRIPGTPVGPGEGLLLGWIMVVTVPLLLQGKARVTSLGRPVLLFWTLAYALLLVGWAVALGLGLAADSAFHDLPAFLFVGTAMMLLVLRPHAEEEIRRAGLLVVLFTVIPLTILLGVWFTNLSIGLLLSGSGRYAGWATNANQVAMVVSPAPFVALHAFRRARSGWARAGYLLLVAGALAVGMATLSDGLVVGWGVSGLVFGLVAWWSAARRRRLPLAKAAFVYVLVPLTAVMLVVGGAYPAWLSLQRKFDTMYHSQNNQGSMRFNLWAHGVQAIGHSPAVGLGPGGHSGILGPFDDEEAHNTVIDWGMSTGVLGILLYLTLLAWVIRQPLRARSASMLAVVVVLGTFSMFHYVLRHPLFWFYLLFVVAESTAMLQGRDGGRDPDGALGPGVPA
jgi:O-antigen ligase